MSRKKKIVPLQKMTEPPFTPTVSPEVAKAYLQSLLHGENLPADPFEQAAAVRFIGVHGEIERMSRRGQELEQELRQLQAQMVQAVGEAQGLGKLLSQAYVQRTPTETLETLQKKLGADQVAAVDTKGRVLETTGKESRS